MTDKTDSKLAGTTFKAKYPPLNLAIHRDRFAVVLVNFSKDGYFTTEEEWICEVLRKEYNHLCEELEFEEQTVMVEKTKPLDGGIAPSVPSNKTTLHAANVGAGMHKSSK